MSRREKSQKAAKERPISAEMRAAMARNEAYSIEQATAFERKYGHLDSHDLGKAAFEAEMLGFRLRHMLWLRNYKNHQGN